MKKWSVLCLAAFLTASLCACGAKGTVTKETVPAESESIEVVETAAVEENAEETAEAAETEEVSEEAVQEEQQEQAPVQEVGPVSFLTGLECTEEERNARPLAVMLNNIKAGCPQSGIAQASVIYEAPVEKADITRLMALFENWQDMDHIGYIRSSRDYFVYCALEFDAIYAHFGQATPYVGDLLNSDAVDNISGAVAGIDRPASKAYMRTDERKAPHNVYTTGQDVLDAVNKFEYSLTYHDTHSQKFIFALPGKRISYDNGTDATVLYPGGKEKGVPNGFSNVQSRFEYNPEDGKYYRYQYGDKHIDEQTGEQLAVDNVIFQYCDGEFRDDNGYMAFNVHGGFNPGDSESQSYRAQIFTGGKMVEASWFRVNNESPAIYVGKDGNGVILNPGKTWICLIWNDHADDVVIE